jgi:hypothetical protein
MGRWDGKGIWEKGKKVMKVYWNGRTDERTVVM